MRLLEAERIKVIKVTKQNKHRAQKGSKIPKGHSEAVSQKGLEGLKVPKR